MNDIKKDSPDSTVFVIEDSVEISKPLCWTLESVNYKVKSYTNAEEFLEDKNSYDNCCLILDIRLPGMSGLMLQEELNAMGINIPIIFISAFGDIKMAVDAMKAGAIDFLVKPVRDQELLETVYEGLKNSPSQTKRNHILALLKTLTSRERQVLALLLEGKQNKQIADELHRSCKTIEVHRANIIEKMEVKNTIQLIRLVANYELIDDEFVLSAKN